MTISVYALKGELNVEILLARFFFVGYITKVFHACPCMGLSAHTFNHEYRNQLQLCFI